MGLPVGNQAIWTPSPVQGLTGTPGMLTPVLGLAPDCSAKSDRRGCWRMLDQGTPTGELYWEKKGARIPVLGGMAQQA